MAIHGATVLIQTVPQSGTATTIAGQRNCTINTECETVETHSKTDFPDKTYISSWQSWSCDFDGVFTSTDFVEELIEGGTVNVKVLLGDGSSAPTMTGTAIVTKASIEAPQDDIATISCTLTGTGALTVA